MKKIGLTGGIGSGKSTVAELFHALGVPVFNSDLEARKLQDENEELKSAIAAVFGNEIHVNGKLDRPRLSEIVFSDKSKLEQLNAIVHPAVAKSFEAFCLKNKNAVYVLKEAAILFEIGAQNYLDAMIVVSAPDELRLNRVMYRDGLGREEVLMRMKSQMSQEEKVMNADFVITNDELQFLAPQIVKIDAEIRSRFSG